MVSVGRKRTGEQDISSSHHYNLSKIAINLLIGHHFNAQLLYKKNYLWQAYFRSNKLSNQISCWEGYLLSQIS